MTREEIIADLQQKIQDHPELYQQIALAEPDGD